MTWDGRQVQQPGNLEDFFAFHYAGVTTRFGTDEVAALTGRVTEDFHGANATFARRVLQIVEEVVPDNRLYVAVDLLYKVQIDKPGPADTSVYLRGHRILDSFERFVIAAVGPTLLNSDVGGLGFYDKTDVAITQSFAHALGNSPFSLFGVDRPATDDPKLKQIVDQAYKVFASAADKVIAARQADPVDVTIAVKLDFTRNPCLVGNNALGMFVFVEPTHEGGRAGGGFFRGDESHSGAILLQRCMVTLFEDMNWQSDTSELWMDLIFGCLVDFFPSPNKNVDKHVAPLLVNGLKDKIRLVKPWLISLCGRQLNSLYKALDEKTAMDPFDALLKEIPIAAWSETIFTAILINIGGEPTLVLHTYDPSGAKYFAADPSSYNNIIAVGLACHLILLQCIQEVIGSKESRFVRIKQAQLAYGQRAADLMKLGASYLQEQSTVAKFRSYAPVAPPKGVQPIHLHRYFHEKDIKLVEVDHREQQFLDLVTLYSQLKESGDSGAAKMIISSNLPPLDSEEFASFYNNLGPNKTGKSIKNLWMTKYLTATPDTSWFDQPPLVCSVTTKAYNSKGNNAFRVWFCLNCDESHYGGKDKPLKFKHNACVNGRTGHKTYWYQVLFPCQIEDKLDAYADFGTMDPKYDFVRATIADCRTRWNVVIPTWIQRLPWYNATFERETTVYVGPKKSFATAQFASEDRDWLVTLIGYAALIQQPERAPNDFLRDFDEHLDKAVGAVLTQANDGNARDWLKKLSATEWTWSRLYYIVVKWNCDSLEEAMRGKMPICVWTCTDGVCDWFGLGNARHMNALRFHKDKGWQRVSATMKHPSSVKSDLAKHDSTQLRHVVKTFAELPMEVQVMLYDSERKGRYTNTNFIAGGPLGPELLTWQTTR
jgi:hypothetical protein